MNRNIQQLASIAKTKRRILLPWTQPVMTSNSSHGLVTTSSEYPDNLRQGYRATDNNAGTEWLTPNGTTSGWWDWKPGVILEVASITITNNFTTGGAATTTSIYTGSDKQTKFDITRTFPYANSQVLVWQPSSPVEMSELFIEMAAGGAYGGFTQIALDAKEVQYVF